MTEDQVYQMQNLESLPEQIRLREHCLETVREPET